MLAEYEDYATESMKNFAKRDAVKRYALVDSLKDLKPEKVLDLGCGAGQELLPFLERTDAVCVGVDRAEKLGEFTKNTFAGKERAVFVRSAGENLPFEDASFDVILCLVALPYMDNQKAIGEISRVLKPNGVLILKVHAPLFFFGMMRERIKTLNPKQLIYPLICLAGTCWHLLTGKQLQKGFWKGKEVFQTRRFLEKEFAKNNMQIKKSLPDNNSQTPSFYVVKMALLKIFFAAQILGESSFVL